MTAIAHTVPASVKMLDGASFGEMTPGFQVTSFETGPSLAKAWFDGQLGMWQWAVPVRTAAQLLELRAWLRHVRAAAGVTWVVEPISWAHPELVIGPLTDGTRYTYHAGMMAPADEAVFVGGAYQDGGYTLRAVANLLTDNQANVTVATTGLEAFGTTTIARSTDFAFDGTTAIWCKPAGSQPNIGAKITSAAAIAAAATRKYTAMATFRGAGTMALSITWLDSGKGVLSTETAVTGTGSTTSNLTLTLTATAPASTEYAIVNAYRTTDSALGFWIGCLALNCGDYDTWHLPSQAPGLVEFASAPATRQRVTVAGTGARVARCIMMPTNTWAVRSPGNVFPGSISLREAPEF